jgi:hypothetical protein
MSASALPSFADVCSSTPPWRISVHSSARLVRPSGPAAATPEVKPAPLDTADLSPGFGDQRQPSWGETNRPRAGGMVKP